uniref:Uncharacterized protein n=1 Tax=Anopheles quadriannulatus TaxID=34691 RepID=A0A182XU07_ANOQN
MIQLLLLRYISNFNSEHIPSYNLSKCVVLIFRFILLPRSIN